MKDFIEQQIIEAVRGILTGLVNEILGQWQFVVPLFEISEYQGRAAVVPAVTLSGCERTEKERIVRLDAYSMSISFSLQETPESELYCYAYANAFCKALEKNPTLGGIADRAVVTGKKYTPPNKRCGGNEWEVTINVRVTVENPHPCGFST